MIELALGARRIVAPAHNERPLFIICLSDVCPLQSRPNVMVRYLVESLFLSPSLGHLLFRSRIVWSFLSPLTANMWRRLRPAAVPRRASSSLAPNASFANSDPLEATNPEPNKRPLANLWKHANICTSQPWNALGWRPNRRRLAGWHSAQSIELLRA
jgi:hypothetical protein